MTPSDRPHEGRFEEVVERSIEANVRYYRALGEVINEYLRALASAWGSLLPPLDLGWLRASPFSPGSPAASAPPPPRPSAAPATPAILLEGMAGEEARGAFAVSNRLPHRVSAPVRASSFRDPAGREVQPAMRIEPEVVTLEPGARALLQIVAVIGEELEPGVAYRGALSVPGLADGQVTVLLRRRPGSPAVVPQQHAETARQAAPSKVRGQRGARRPAPTAAAVPAERRPRGRRRR